MPTNQRAQPDIPDHEVLRKVGGGAYGEVWMARGITGAYRAVKVVWREDFDDERSFEREFEGILKFEPISRDHPGLVNILHVGRSKDSVSFYYYVMELGDDVTSGREINAVEYEARTLRSDIKYAKGSSQDVALCIESGIRLADALEHLHERGLAHRDVKPANVIFVNGKAKLADIGLVADRGQMTFVGTEGFVPPEGPGSAQADVYSLGKVLYEVATGKDRLQFPEVPDELHPDTELKQWLALNRVLCDICEPKISKRTITSSSQLAIALRRIGAGKKLKSGKGLVNGVLWMALLGFTGYAIFLALPYIEKWEGWVQKPIDVNPVPVAIDVTPGNDPVVEIPTITIPEKKICIVNFYVNPDDAEVFTPEGQWMGNVESYLRERVEEVGTEIHVLLKKEGYEDLEVFYVVPDEDQHFPELTMKLDQPPQPGDPWWDALGTKYLPGKDKSRPTNKMHESEPVSDVMWELYSERKDVSAVALKFSKFQADSKEKRIVCLAKRSAEAMAEWLTEESIKVGRLKPSQQIVALHGWKYLDRTISNTEENSTELAPFRLMARYIPYASIELRTQPKGAKVWIDGDFVGLTDNTFQEIPPGKWEIKIEKDGYESFEKTFTFGEDELLTPDGINLKINDSLITGMPWLWESGMKFVPVTENLMASAFETRVKDFQEYIVAQNKAGASIEMPVPTRNKDADEPVVHVTYDEAVKYAAWLTERDRELGQISRSHTYRLPTDTEWSLLVGIQEVGEMGIAKRALKHKDELPWEGNWTVENKKLVPMVEGADPIGNFSDETRKKYNRKLGKYFKGYTDGESGTAAVGQYKANVLGIHDLAGNVSEMLSNTVGSNNLRVVRGSNFKSYLIKDLRSSYRTYLGSGVSTDSIGFRLVIDYREEEAAEVVGEEAAGERDE